MQNQKFSLKRVALGVLVGVVALGGVASAGQAMQANMFNNLVAWLVGQNCYYDMYGAYICDDYDDGGEYIDNGGEPIDNGGEPIDNGGEPIDNGGEYIDNGGEPIDNEGEYIDNGGEYIDNGGEYYDDSYDNNCYYDSTGLYICDGTGDDSYNNYDNYNNYNNYDTDSNDGSNDTWDSNYDDSYNDSYDEQDDSWKEDQKEEMADMLEETEYWEEDMEDSKDEVNDWLEEIDWRLEQWTEDYDDDYDYLNDSQRALYEEATAFAQKAYGKVEGLTSKFDELKEEVAQSKQNMEDAYTAFVNGTSEDSSEFWDANTGGAMDWRDVYRSQAEMWGRLLNFYDFLLEVERAKRDTGIDATEMSEGMTEAIALAEYVITNIQDSLENTLPGVIAEAETAIENGEDSWRAVDDIRDFLDDMRDMMDDDRDMWDAMEEFWDYAKDKGRDDFAENELKYLKEDLNGAWTQIAEYEEMGYDMSTFKELIERAEEILAELEELEASGDFDERDMEDLWDELDEIGKKAEKEADKFGMDFGSDKKNIYAETIDVNDVDALLELLSKIPENVLDQVLEMLLSNVSSYQIEQFINYNDKYGNIGVFESASMAYGDADTLDAMIADKLAKLEELDRLIAEKEGKVAELGAGIAAYNFGVGDASEEVDNIIAQLDGDLDDGEIDDLQKEVDDLKEQAKEEKYEDELIPFKDCDDDQWFTAYVWGAKQEGIVDGYKDSNGNSTGEFGPENSINLAELSKIALEMAGVDVDENGNPDNPYAKDLWAAGYIATAEDMGLSVYEDITVSPAENASRGEVLAAFYEAAGIEVDDVEDFDNPFYDVSEDDEYAKYVLQAYEDGIVAGYKDASGNLTGEFGINNDVNRAEAAKMLENFMDNYGEWVGEMNPLPSP